ncbi:hypothetical protein ACFX11_019776 [Malus domestica]
MAQPKVEELVVHLEKFMDLSTMEHGIELVGVAFVNRTLNKLGVRNIFRSFWKELGEIEVKWVRDNTFIITVQDESTTTKILNQIRGLTLYLTSEANVRRLANEIKEFMEFEDLSKVRGFLRARVMVNTFKPLTTGCWLPRENNKDTWVEFRYERLQDFCYRCGILGAIIFGAGEKMLAGVMRYGATPTSQPNVEIKEQGVRGENDPNPLDLMQTEEVHDARKGRKRRYGQKYRKARVGSNPAQWIMTEGTPKITHHVFMGYRPSSFIQSHILGVQSRQMINSSVMI